MDDQKKYIAYKAIDENIQESKARQIIRYVLECEIWQQDTVNPTNAYLAKKYGWAVETVKVAISQAKKSQFITTTGYGKSRCLELNVSFLKGKMAEILMRKPLGKVDIFEGLPIEQGNTLGNSLGNTLGNSLGNSLEQENPCIPTQNEDLGRDNNNNYNNNNNSSKANALRENMNEVISGSRQLDLVQHQRVSSQAQRVMSAFHAINPGLSILNATQKSKAKELVSIHGLDKVLAVIKILPQTNNMPYFPVITTPMQLLSKWAELEARVKKEMTVPSNKNKTTPIV